MTITYPALGKNGRLGNCMFQVAATAGTAWSRFGDFVLPEEAARLVSGLAKFPRLRDRWRSIHELPDGPFYEERRFPYDPIPAEAIRLHGYFQSSRYWRGWEQRVRELFHAEGSARDLFPADLDPRRCCAVHVRRGDYVRFASYHTNLGLAYYENALWRVREAGFDHSLVFSDDPDWCWDLVSRAWWGHAQIMPLGDEVDDLLRFAVCGAHVIANSSWSWWGAYLGHAPGKLVVAPEAWFGPKGPPDWQDVYEEGWVVL